MQIILVSSRLTTAKAITVQPWHLVSALVAFTVLVFSLASAFSFITLKHASEWKLPLIDDMIATARNEEIRRSELFVRENLNTMAVKLGQMQAQLIQLDTLGSRLAKFAGVKAPEPVRTSPPPGQGGPLVSENALSAIELEAQMKHFADLLSQQDDYLGVIESELLLDQASLSLVPSTLPVIGSAWNTSGFGWRIDPFNGSRAMHEGVDFVAEVGTPIIAAAAGVVTAASYHPQYGNMIEIDHGRDLSTRYAHASKLSVSAGMIVKRGQKIAEVGSTGRSTGPHLHFEVRVKDVAQNPNRFLELARKAQPAGLQQAKAGRHTH
ncbi:MAG: M23 family metallopeptidase [Pseudomonadota bacterium]|uniref:M23 family metallopeptidase n=1 Tax=Methyloversatilis sp. TaxID=2569862 RepID=UPI002736EAB6|nr:M23 family metallopeptidase [Methyloversatilis sp.]MDP3871933.1 M23 family metallopeptidase [Methyloversatilis sp.]